MSMFHICRAENVAPDCSGAAHAHKIPVAHSFARPFRAADAHAFAQPFAENGNG